MTAVHLLHSKFLQPSYAWKKENCFGIRCFIQLLLKVEVQNFWGCLITFFSSIGKAICSFVSDAVIWPTFYYQFSPVLTSSSVGQGQNKGQSNPFYLLQLCKLKVVGNILFLSVTKELTWTPTLISTERESQICEFLMQNVWVQWPPRLMSIFHFQVPGQIK